jgi:hypothetical protein
MYFVRSVPTTSAVTVYEYYPINSDAGAVLDTESMRTDQSYVIVVLSKL